MDFSSHLCSLLPFLPRDFIHHWLLRNTHVYINNSLFFLFLQSLFTLVRLLLRRYISGILGYFSMYDYKLVISGRLFLDETFIAQIFFALPPCSVPGMTMIKW